MAEKKTPTPRSLGSSHRVYLTHGHFHPYSHTPSSFKYPYVTEACSPHSSRPPNAAFPYFVHFILQYTNAKRLHGKGEHKESFACILPLAASSSTIVLTHGDLFAHRLCHTRRQTRFLSHMARGTSRSARWGRFDILTIPLVKRGE